MLLLIVGTADLGVGGLGKYFRAGAQRGQLAAVLRISIVNYVYSILLELS